VIAVKTGDSVKLNQLVNTAMTGAASGSLWGLLFGMVFLNPLIGVALGAGAGALGGALTDFGIKDQFMKDLASKVKSGDAVLFLLIQSMTADKVLNEIKDAGGTVLKTSLDEKRAAPARYPRSRNSAQSCLGPGLPSRVRQSVEFELKHRPSPTTPCYEVMTSRPGLERSALLCSMMTRVRLPLAGKRGIRQACR
jgi:uncharacterized membrane protein